MENPRVPRKALVFLRWFCREDYLSEIEGDLTELFQLRAETLSTGQARRLFWWDVLRSFRPVNIKKIGFTFFSFTMIRHHITAALRSFAKHKSSFLINVTGLSTGLACTMLIVLWIADELKYDRFYPKAEEIYKVLGNYGFTSEITTGEWLPGPLAAALRSDYPEIAHATVITWNEDHLISNNDTHIKASGKFTDEDFLEVFNRPLTEGVSTSLALAEPSAIAVSQSLAVKLFGHEKALDREVRFDLEHSFVVKAVFEDFPVNSTIQVDWIAPFTFFEKSNPWVANWGNGGPQTYVRLQPGADHQLVSEKLAGEIKRHINEDATKLFLYPFTNYYLYGNFEKGKQAGGRIEYVRLFGLIAAFILAIACFNFMNLATARASRRAKEIGIRKAIGARRWNLLGQFFSESFLITFLSACLGGMFVLLALPYFNNLTDKHISMSLEEPIFYVYIVGSTFITGFFAGIYPAIYLSSLNAVKMLKGSFTGSTFEVIARKGLVVFQFSLSIVLVLATWVIYQQIQYIQAKNMGYNKENLITFVSDEEFIKKEKVFEEQIRKLSGVVSTSGSNSALTQPSSNTGNVQWEGKAEDDLMSFEVLRTDYDFIKTLGIEMVDGRDFSREFATDTARIIINEAAAKVMGLENAVGTRIKVWNQEWEIAGVARDFHFASVHSEITPLIMMLSPGISYYYWIRINGNTTPATIGQITKIYKELVPEYPFEFAFFDQKIGQLYKSEQRIGTLSAFSALFAVLISALGLFGLSAHMAERRTKEVGIRKILGASISHLVLLLNKEFTWLVLLAIALSCPIGWYLMSIWLDEFEFKIPLSGWHFAGAASIALVIAWATIALQSYKAASVNPVQSLRNNE
jgi:putative ABC transport system permease protein